MEKHSWPKRKKPASGVFISPDQPTIVYLTVCSKDRIPWLAQPIIHNALVNIWKEAEAWMVGYYLLMPDHLHPFCAPKDTNISLDNWVIYWKRLFSKEYHNPRWKRQSQKWDTRLRRTEKYEEKWKYVRMNPVRKGLVANPDEWPYQGMIHELLWF